MKFIDTMASFKYLGGALPMHVTMMIYGYLVYTKEYELIWINPDCTNELPKLSLEDVLYMMIAHSVCVFIMSFRRILGFFQAKNCKAIYFQEILKITYVAVYLLAILYTQLQIMYKKQDNESIENHIIACANREGFDHKQDISGKHQQLTKELVENLDMVNDYRLFETIVFYS